MIVAPFTAEAVYSLEAPRFGHSDPSESVLADIHRVVVACEARGVPLSRASALTSGGACCALEMLVDEQWIIGFATLYNSGSVWVDAPNTDNADHYVGAHHVDLSTAIDWLSDCWREQQFRWRA
jgi:hypothetical protein